jgi:hypothetical protein
MGDEMRRKLLTIVLIVAVAALAAGAFYAVRHRSCRSSALNLPVH